MLIVVSLLIPPYNLKHFPKTFGPLKLSLTHIFPQIFLVTKQKSKEILERDGTYLNHSVLGLISQVVFSEVTV